jgi:hypothetical protein
LSPTATFSSLTTPACDDGISIDALSLSTVTRLCSALIVSPGLTSSSMTATSLKSPMSGTLISIVAMSLVSLVVLQVFSFSVCSRTGSAELVSNSQPARTPASATSRALFARGQVVYIAPSA